MPLSCFLCGQLLRAGTRKFTLVATLLPSVGGTAWRGVGRRKHVSVCGGCFTQIEPDKSAENDEA